MGVGDHIGFTRRIHPEVAACKANTFPLYLKFVPVSSLELKDFERSGVEGKGGWVQSASGREYGVDRGGKKSFLDLEEQSQSLGSDGLWIASGVYLEGSGLWKGPGL